MFKTKNLLILLFSIALVTTLHTASADVVYQETCNLQIFPYDPTATDITNPNLAAQWVNKLSTTECEKYLKFPKTSANPVQYQPQPPLDGDTPLIPGAENKKVAWTTHEHAYFNESDHNDGKGYYYKSFVDKFEITLEADAKSNLDFGANPGVLDNMQCVTSVPGTYTGDISSIEDCDGTVDDLYGRTTVTKKQVGNKVVVTWDFAEGPTTGGRPQIYGNNGNNFNTYENGQIKYTLNLEDPFSRFLDFGVNFKSDNNPQQIWSATTTSKVFLGDLALKKTNYPQNFEKGCFNNDVNNTNSGWCYLSAKAGYPTEDVTTPSGTYKNTFYWYPIGSVSTVWKKPQAPPASYCTGLSITAPGAPTLTPSTNAAYDYEMPPLTEATFNVIPTFSTTPVPLDYRWTANYIFPTTPPPTEGGYFKDFKGQITPVSDPFGYNPYPDTDNIIGQDDRSTFYTGGSGGIFVTVRGVEPGTSDYVGNDCMSTIYIPPGPPPSKMCKQLEILVDEYDPQTASSNPTILQNMIADRIYNIRVDSNNTIYNDTPPSKIPEYRILLHNPDTELTPGVELKLSSGQNCPQPLYAILMDKHFLIADKIPTNLNCVYEYNSQAEDTITMTAIPDDSRPLCTVKKEITAPPVSEKECKELQIHRDNAVLVPDVVPFEEPINNLYAVIDTDPQEYAEDLNVSWTSEGGGKIVTFAAQQGSNYELITPHMTDTVNLYDVVDGTKVTAKAIDPNDPTADLDICEDSFVVGTPPQNICYSLNLTPVNASVQAGESVNISANPKNVNAPHPNYIQWTETGPGHFETGPNSIFQTKYLPHGNIIPNFPSKFPQKFSKVCPLVPHGTDVSFKAPAHCDYTYVAGQAGGGSFRIEADPNLGDIADCIYEYTVPPLTKDLYCESLDVNPYGQINLNTTNPYTAKAIFRDASNNNAVVDFPEIVIGWNGTDGTFDPTTTTGPSTETFQSTFTSTSTTNGSINVAVTDVPGKTVDLTNCQQTFSKKVTPPPKFPYCTGLTLIPNEIKGGQLNPYTAVATFSDLKKYTVVTEWSGNRGIYTSNGNSITETTSLSDQIANTFQSTANNQGEVRVRLTDVIEPNVDPNSEVCQETVVLDEEEECRKIRIEEVKPDIYCVVEIDADGELVFEWKVLEGEIDFNKYNILPSEECVEINEITPPATLRVEAEGYENICYDEVSFQPEKPKKPKLEKRIQVGTSTGKYTNSVITLPHTPGIHKLFYQLTFTPHNGQMTTATISDPISDGINADVLPTYKDAQGIEREYNVGGDISYKNNMVVREDGDRLYPCSDIDPNKDEVEHCYNGDIGSNFFQLYKVAGEVTIEYEAELKTNLDDRICAVGEICEEQYTNKADAFNINVEINGQVTKVENVESNEILVQIFCQYILTRAAGDIFLETDLLAGIDINQCSEYVSTPGIIVTPGTRPDRELFKTGAGEATIFAVEHEACTAGQSGSIDEDLTAFYGADVAARLSSQICEVKLRTGGAWQQEVITNSIEENKTRISRWEADNISGQDATISGEIGNHETLSKYEVYHIKDANLTMEASSLADGAGAKTIIVENGDLYINGDITYAQCNTGDCSSPRSVASLAFIVLNGNIYVGPEVETMAGVYYVQEGDTQNTGQLLSGNAQSQPINSFVTLAIYGSVYGDIEPLLTYRRYAGDPALEQGGIVIRFDERVVLNTPPGLRDVLNLSQTEVAR